MRGGGEVEGYLVLYCPRKESRERGEKGRTEGEAGRRVEVNAGERKYDQGKSSLQSILPAHFSPLLRAERMGPSISMILMSSECSWELK